MKKMRLTILVALCCLVALLMSFAVSADTGIDNGWQMVDGNWRYGRDGKWVTQEVIKLGNAYFAFDYYGDMYSDQQFSLNGYYYRAKENGQLYVNSWYSNSRDGDYYYGDAGRAVSGFVQVGFTTYYFSNSGKVTKDQALSINNNVYAFNESGTSYKLLSEGWNNAFGKWYYCYYSGSYQRYLSYASSTYRTIDGDRYYFYSNGQMASGEVISSTYLATNTGVLHENGWVQLNGYWYYAVDRILYGSGIYKIDGKLYYFDNECRLYKIPGDIKVSGYHYYVGDGGALYRNQWRYDKTGSRASDYGWIYYGDTGKRTTGLAVIGNNKYYFNSGGIMQANTVLEINGCVYLFDKNGIGTEKNGWVRHPSSKLWMYAKDGSLVRGMLVLDDEIYGFYSDGTLVTQDYLVTYHPLTGVDARYMFDQNGKLITTIGWRKSNGNWYYVADRTGRLQEGWMELGGKWYYFNPQMINNTIFLDSASQYYVADNEGVCTQLSGNGWRDVYGGKVYLENGRPFMGQWKYISGNWYYFQSSGYAVLDTVYWINSVPYLFGTDGKLSTGGWQQVGGCHYYATPSGVVSTGLKTIDGKQYLFSGDGYLLGEGLYTYNSCKYWVAEDGVVIGQVREGWNELNGNKYYVKNGTVQRNKLLWIDDVCYGFDSDYAMCKNGVYYLNYDYYMFDANGHLLTGWQTFDGKWYYANPKSSDPYIYNNGIYVIDGKDYAFQDGYMRIGCFFAWGAYITTNNGGVVTSRTELKNGWNYTGSGYIYLKNGQPYTGWVGNVYTQSGEMLVNQVLEYAGEYYWLGAGGIYAKNKWVQDAYGDWMYAKADGTLCSNEWLLQNGKYYYFNDCYAICNDHIILNGVAYAFDNNGTLVAEYDPSKAPAVENMNGWNKIGGRWYYYHAGEPVFGHRYIGGKWYYFTEDGMVASATFDGYYYNSEGVRASYTGWKKVAGYWCYFGADNRMHQGWIKSGNNWCFTEWVVDERTQSAYCAMVANATMCYNGKLYRFDGNGYCTGVVETNGWYKAASDWYYLVNGYVIQGTYYKIGTNYYVFGEDGVMLTDVVYWVDSVSGGGYKYFDGNGKAATTAGWKKYKGNWIYVNEEGFLCADGIYRIAGKDYSFMRINWIV